MLAHVFTQLCSKVQSSSRILPNHKQNGAITQRCTTFVGQGPKSIAFGAIEGRRQNYDLNLRKSSVYNQKQNLFHQPIFNACGLQLLPSELIWIVIRSKNFNSSTKFEFIQKILVIQKKFLLPFNLLRGPDITRSRQDCYIPFYKAGLLYTILQGRTAISHFTIVKFPKSLEGII